MYLHCILTTLPAGASQGNGAGDGDEEDGAVHRRGKEGILERGEHYSSSTVVTHLTV